MKLVLTTVAPCGLHVLKRVVFGSCRSECLSVALSGFPGALVCFLSLFELKGAFTFG